MLESLLKCPECADSDLYVFMDEARNDEEADAVENEPGVVLPYQPLAEGDDPQQAKEARQQVDGVFEPERRLAYEQVTGGSAAYGRRRADDEGAEEIELLGSRKAGARHGTCQRTYQLENHEGPWDAEQVAHILKELLNDLHWK